MIERIVYYPDNQIYYIGVHPYKQLNFVNKQQYFIYT